jgi:diacylglycerol kinase family enzyme
MASSSKRRVCILLNRNAGTVRGADTDALVRRICEPFLDRGDLVDLRLRAPRRLAAETRALSRQKAHDLIVLGGGDGTLSRCARDLQDHPATLAFLPLGTMNLFARALGMPMEPGAAALAIAGGRQAHIDVGLINGDLFLHHVSFGLHPALIRQRERMTHRSRLGKMIAGARAFWLTVRKPRRLRLLAKVDGTLHERPVTALIVSNNAFGRGHMPYADWLTGGRLGVYFCHSFSWPSLLRIGAETLLGRFAENPEIASGEAVRVDLDAGRGKQVMASVDGELVRVSLPGSVDIVPGRLSVMLPAAETQGSPVELASEPGV